MGDAIDRLSKALASGRSRREALVALATASVAFLPWTAEGKNKQALRRRRRRQRRLAQFEPFLADCEEWCASTFALGTKQRTDCIDLARTGQGACYSEIDRGPGFYCTKEQICQNGRTCCPDISGGGPVVSGPCCVGGCDAINGTALCFL
jgi:hypothetical protein